MPFGTLFKDPGRQKENERAREQNRKNIEYTSQMYHYENDRGQDAVDQARRQNEINRRNQDRNIARDQLQLDNNRNYAMQIRQMNFDNQRELQEASAQQAAKNMVFNKRGYANAIEEQNNYMLDQKISFELDRLNIDIKGRQGVEQYALNTAMTDQQQRASRAKSSFAMQAEQIKGMKALGLARAKGQAGRTAGKNAQAAIAESGFQQAVIAEETTLAGEQYKLDSRANAKQLSDLSEQLIMQNQEIDLGEDSLERQDALQRKKLKLQLEQANADAMGRILRDPKLAPMIPETPWLADYKAEFLEPLDWVYTPKPPRTEVAQDRGTLLGDIGDFVQQNASLLMGGFSALGGGDGMGILSFLGGDISSGGAPGLGSLGSMGIGSTNYNFNPSTFNTGSGMSSYMPSNMNIGGFGVNVPSFATGYGQGFNFSPNWY